MILVSTPHMTFKNAITKYTQKEAIILYTMSLVISNNQLGALLEQLQSTSLEPH